MQPWFINRSLERRRSVTVAAHRKMQRVKGRKSNRVPWTTAPPRFMESYCSFFITMLFGGKDSNVKHSWKKNVCIRMLLYEQLHTRSCKIASFPPFYFKRFIMIIIIMCMKYLHLWQYCAEDDIHWYEKHLYQLIKTFSLNLFLKLLCTHPCMAFFFLSFSIKSSFFSLGYL